MSYLFKSLLTACCLGLVGPSLAQIVVKIGHAGPLSGGLAHYGKDTENGARLAIEDLNRKGIKIGDQSATFELVSEDDRTQPEQAKSVAKKLVDAKVSGVVGHLSSGNSIVASPIYNEASIPLITPSGTNPTFTRKGYPIAFRVIADDAQAMAVLVSHAINTLKAKNFAIIIIEDRSTYGTIIAQSFKSSVARAGGLVVAEASIGELSINASSQLAAVVAKAPDVVFFGGMDGQAGRLIRQLNGMGHYPKFMGGDGICSESLPKFTSDTLRDDQVICPEAGDVQGENAAGLSPFKARYKSRFNADALVYAAFAYDAVNVMAEAMIRAGSSVPAKYLPELAKTNGHQGVTGTISFDEKGDIKQGAVTLFTYRGGKRTAVAVLNQ